MVDDSFFNRIFSAAAGVWALVGMVAVALFKTWPLILGRFNERYRDRLTEEAGDWERIRHERDLLREERDLVRDRWAECEAEKAALMGENAELRGILQSLGEWRQFQAYRDALRRQSEGKDSE